MSTNRKSAKELAFLQDLFIAPDWGERFAELIDEHVKLPAEGEALYVAAGTGAHAMALHERAAEKLELLCVDENAECMEWPAPRLRQPTRKSVLKRRRSIVSTLKPIASIWSSAMPHS